MLIKYLNSSGVLLTIVDKGYSSIVFAGVIVSNRITFKQTTFPAHIETYLWVYNNCIYLLFTDIGISKYRTESCDIILM